MSLLDQIITRLDMNSPQQAKIKVFTLQNADARQMSELLMQLFRMTQSQATIGTQRAVQYTLVRPRNDDNGNPLEDVQLGSATVGTAEQHALTVTIDPRTNSLLVGGTDHYVTLVSQIIETLDASPANERKSEVVRLKNSQAQEVGLSIRTFLDQERQRVTQVLGADAIGTAQRMLEREVAVVPEPVSNTLLVSANPRYFEQIRELINELDKAQPQVLIQVLLAEVTLDSLTDLGVEWNYSGSKGDVKYGAGTDFGVPKQLQDFGGYSTAITGSDFNFMLRALKDQGRLEVLSRPQIVTADNKPAAINIGQRVPLITDSRVTERGDTINSFRYEDVGVNLTVTPKISPDGFVKMEIGTTNSALSSSTVEVNKSATVPIINQRRANTTVSVQSGQTIIIGGLIATLDDRRVKKVPVLGSIPYLGALFRSTHTSRERKELLILLTPQVLNNPQTPVPLQDLQSITKEQTLNSTIGDSIKRDRLQKQIMDPIFPTNRPPNSPKPEPIKL
jgi:type II secretion system protein D